LLSSDLIRRARRSRLFVIGALFTALLVLPGCWVMSINALYEESPRDPDIVVEKNLSGAWSLTDDKCTTILTVTVSEEVYDLKSVQRGTECNDAGKESRQQARLVKLGAHYFLDTSPWPDQICDACLPLHWIFQVKIDKDVLALSPIESDGVKKQREAGSVHLEVLPRDPKPAMFESPITLTALPRDLKDFCRRFADDKSVFKPESVIVFRRV